MKESSWWRMLGRTLKGQTQLKYFSFVFTPLVHSSATTQGLNQCALLWFRIYLKGGACTMSSPTSLL